jgi:hypothetical protein
VSVSVPISRAQAGRVGGYANFAKNGARNAGKARVGLLEKLADQVDPDHRLSDAQRRARAKAALNAHLTRISAAGVEARRQKRARREAQLSRHKNADQGTSPVGVKEGGGAIADLPPAA